MTQDNPTVVAAEMRTPPALKKLARAYIALARQFSSATEAPAMVNADIATQSQDSAR